MCNIKKKPRTEKNSQFRLTLLSIGLIVLVVSVLVLVFAAFIVHLVSPQIPSLISADGMLSYISSGVSSVATILLAIVAYQQTERANSMADKLSKKSNELAQQSNRAAEQSNELTQRANEMSERVMKLEEERFKMEIRPFVLVTDWQVCEGIPTEFEDKHQTIAYQVGPSNDRVTDCVALILELTNTSQSYEIVRYCNATSKDGEKWGLCVEERNGPSLCILAGENRKICFYAGNSFFSDIEGTAIKFEFVLENRFDERYRETFDLFVMRFNWERKDCVTNPQGYEIQAFTKDHKLVSG